MTTINANDTAVSLIGPGEAMDGRVVPAGQLAVVLSSVNGQNVYVYGTAQTLRSLVEVGLSAPVPADVPLYDDDQPAITEPAPTVLAALEARLTRVEEIVRELSEVAERARRNGYV